MAHRAIQATGRLASSSSTSAGPSCPTDVTLGPGFSFGAALTLLNGAAYAVALHNRDSVQAFFGQLCIPPARQILVDAMDAKTFEGAFIADLVRTGQLDERWLNGSYGANWWLRANPSRIAVGLSHLRAQREFLASSYDIAFFVEDDVAIESNWASGNSALTRVGLGLIHDALAHAPKGWQMLWLGYCFEGCEQQHFIQTSAKTVYKGSELPQCLHGFISTREASGQLVKTGSPLSQAVDRAFGLVATTLRSYNIVPSLLTQGRVAMASQNHDAGDFKHGFRNRTGHTAPLPFKPGCPPDGVHRYGGWRSDLFVHIHVPKTGGTSLSSMLYSLICERVTDLPPPFDMWPLRGTRLCRSGLVDTELSSGVLAPPAPFRSEHAPFMVQSMRAKNLAKVYFARDIVYVTTLRSGTQRTLSNWVHCMQMCACPGRDPFNCSKSETGSSHGSLTNESLMQYMASDMTPKRVNNVQVAAFASAPLRVTVGEDEYNKAKDVLSDKRTQWMVGFADCMGSIYKQLTYMRHLQLDTETYERLQGGDKASRFESRLASVGPLHLADSVMNALQRRNALDDRLHAWARLQKGGTRFAHEGCPPLRQQPTAGTLFTAPTTGPSTPWVTTEPGRDR